MLFDFFKFIFLLTYSFLSVVTGCVKYHFYLSVFSSSLSSSRRTIRTDISDFLSPLFSIIHWFRVDFRNTSRIGTELLYVGSSWSSCLGSSIWRGPHRVNRLWARPLLLHLCPTSLVRLTLIVFVMGRKWPYSCCFVGCRLHDLFNIARSILV